MKKKLIMLSSVVAGFLPLVALAQVTGGVISTCKAANITTISGIFCKIAEILNSVLPVLVALGVVYFVWGVVQYVISGDEEGKSKGRDKMIWGIIGLAVIVAVWGLVAILRDTFGLNNRMNIEFPTVPY